MDSNSSGTLNLKYAKDREIKQALKYRLKRRASEVLKAIKQFYPGTPRAILDLGTADGKMLEMIWNDFPQTHCIGMEYDPGLAALAQSSFPQLSIMQCDVQALPLSDMSVDVVVAAAVIEHLPHPERLVSEAQRVLKPGGLLILTCPDPFWEKIATWVGHLAEDQHHHVMNLKELKMLADTSRLEILKAEKFMMSPVGFPAEQAMEKCLRFSCLDFLLANQLLVARKKLA